jgi:predicted lactoylglutathione lyase
MYAYIKIDREENGEIFYTVEITAKVGGKPIVKTVVREVFFGEDVWDAFADRHTLELMTKKRKSK